MCAHLEIIAHPSPCEELRLEQKCHPHERQTVPEVIWTVNVIKSASSNRRRQLLTVCRRGSLSLGRLVEEELIELQGKLRIVTVDKSIS